MLACPSSRFLLLSSPSQYRRRLALVSLLKRPPIGHNGHYHRRLAKHTSRGKKEKSAKRRERKTYLPSASARLATRPKQIRLSTTVFAADNTNKHTHNLSSRPAIRTRKEPLFPCLTRKNKLLLSDCSVCQWYHNCALAYHHFGSRLKTAQASGEYINVRIFKSIVCFHLIAS